jgi:hypothetical protein
LLSTMMPTCTNFKKTILLDYFGQHLTSKLHKVIQLLFLLDTYILVVCVCVSMLDWHKGEFIGVNYQHQ